MVRSQGTGLGAGCHLHSHAQTLNKVMQIGVFSEGHWLGHNLRLLFYELAMNRSQKLRSRPRSSAVPGVKSRNRASRAHTSVVSQAARHRFGGKRTNKQTKHNIVRE